MSFFPDLDRLFENAKNLDAERVWVLAIDEEVKQEIIRLNTRDQMFDKGVDSLNRSLGVYSKSSVANFGKRPGRIQLFDSGEFYASFSIIVDRGGITISANTIKVDEKGVDDLAVRYGIDILGLTPQSLDELLRKFVIENYQEIILNELFKGVA
jgi:hypothetical protein